MASIIGLRSVASTVPFFDFCSLLEKISATKGNDKKKKLLSVFIEQWREAHDSLHGNGHVTDSLYPAMRLLLPHIDKERAAYGMKEVILAKYYIEILGIAKESSDAQKLLNYRAPHAPKQGTGDFASVAYFILKTRCPEKGSLTIEDVNKHLDDLAMANTKRERAEMKKALQILLQNTSALEQKWLIRIIMRDMKIGLSENSVFQIYHPDAMDLFSVCSSLEKVCSDLKSLATHLNEASIALFTPFRPMLGQRANIDQVPRLMDQQPFYVETKFDGDRMQIHKKGNQYKFFSRSSKDYTSSFGASSMEGSFTPNIHAAFNEDIKSCILDGEMVGWNPDLEAYVPKGGNVDVKTVGLDGSVSIQQCFVAFDVLLINDTNLANTPLSKRVEYLDKVFKPVPGYLHNVDRLQGNTKEDVVKLLNEAIDKREEGLVVKMPCSTYKPDKRKGSGWLKIKPEYVDSLSDELDVLIIGGYYGVGHRAGMVSHFLCGVAVPPENPLDKPSLFYTFCKVGSGYTMAELNTISFQLAPHWKPFDNRNPPPTIALALSSSREKPSVWIEPSKSKIVQIRAAEIVPSERYRTGCTLRFPRLEKFRDDKEWFDSMTVEELEQLKSVASGRLAHQHYDEEEGELPASKRRKVATRIARPKGVAPQFKQTNTTDVKEVSEIFKGKQFCIVNGSKDLTKEDMERKIAEHGGSFVQNPGLETQCVIAYKTVQRVKNIIHVGLHDVVKAEWFAQCMNENRCVPFVPSHMIYTSLKTSDYFSTLYDCQGDSYTDDVTEEDLRNIFQSITDKGSPLVNITQNEVSMIESRYFPNDSLLGLFRQYKFYVDRYSEIGNPNTLIKACALDLTAMEIRHHGGTIVDSLEETVTHVVLNEKDLSRLSLLQKVRQGHSKRHHFVTAAWISDCIRDKALKHERIYEPVTEKARCK